LGLMKREGDEHEGLRTAKKRHKLGEVNGVGGSQNSVLSIR